MRHYLKSPSGSCLQADFVGYPALDIARMRVLAASDEGLSPKERSFAAAALDETSRWSAVGDKLGLVLPIQAHPRSEPGWALDGGRAMEHLALARSFHAHRTRLNALSKKRGWLDARGNLLSFAPAFSRAVSLSEGARLEANEPGNLLGCQAAFALFFPDSGGYYEQISSARWSACAPISRARLFESLRSAAKFASSKGLRQGASIVEVQARAVRAHEFAPTGDHTPLMAAIARAEALELDKLMGEQETSWLRERVATLEAERAAMAPKAGSPPENPPRRNRL